MASWGIPVPGYDDADTIGAEIGDITSELLEDVLKLCHPDKHPAERKQLADRVTQELLALKPFVFPAPKPRPEPPEPRDGSLWDFQKPTKDPLRLTYPCADCADLNTPTSTVTSARPNGRSATGKNASAKPSSAANDTGLGENDTSDRFGAYAARSSSSRSGPIRSSALTLAGSAAIASA